MDKILHIYQTMVAGLIVATRALTEFAEFCEGSNDPEVAELRAAVTEAAQAVKRAAGYLSEPMVMKIVTLHTLTALAEREAIEVPAQCAAGKPGAN